MSKTLKELHNLLVDQSKRRGFYPKNEKEVLLRIGEGVGELFEAVREGQSKEGISEEVVDIVWNLWRFCELHGIDFEEAFVAKYEKNEKRPLPKPVEDISENS